jgi:diguanylate cyclase (GGDEF)-like protein
MNVDINTRTWFRFFIAVLGLGAVVLAFRNLPYVKLDVNFCLLAFITLAGTSWFAVKIPGIGGRITVSDTFIYLTVLLYGGEAAVVLAALEGVTSSQRISKKPSTIFFNAGVMALSLLIAVSIVRLFFDRTLETTPLSISVRVLTALVLLSLVQYLVNSWLVAIDRSLKDGSPLLQTWTQHYLWTSLTYFSGAFAAGAVARLITDFGFFPVVLAMPVIAIVYFTYRTYLNSVATAKEHAERAELGIQEKQQYIAELERVRKELQESREYFRHASMHDLLTGLPNRALLMDRIEQSLNRAGRSVGYLFAVLYVDLDHFKAINDNFGHSAGDKLLMTVADRLKKCVRSIDTVARLGGDEFAIVLDDLEDRSVVLQIAERLQREIAKPVCLDDEEVRTTASIGIAVYQPEHHDTEAILHDADRAMYRAKQNGKARHVVANEPGQTDPDDQNPPTTFITQLRSTAVN